MRRNPEKYPAMVIGKKPEKPIFCCENAIIPKQNEIELLGITMDDKLKFEAHISKICRKVSQQIVVQWCRSDSPRCFRLTSGKIYTRHLYYRILNIVQILGIFVVNTNFIKLSCYKTWHGEATTVGAARMLKGLFTRYEFFFKIIVILA